MAAVEIGMHPELYDVNSPVCHPLLRHPLIVCPLFDGVFGELTMLLTRASSASLPSAVLLCDSYYPPGLADVSPPLTTTITVSCTSADLSIKIMWTTMLDTPVKGVKINHFVPLFERPCAASTLSRAEDRLW